MYKYQAIKRIIGMSEREREREMRITQIIYRSSITKIESKFSQYCNDEV